MKRNSLKMTIAAILVFAASCDDPETIVTNYVHPDGSVTRKIEMINKENSFKKSVCKVPYDSSWKISDSISIGEKNDTTWYRTAVKNFISADEINLVYKADTGINRALKREASFSKKFRWFNTEYRFSEKIGRKLDHGYPAKDYLNNEELSFFYSPQSLQNSYLGGKDSTKYKLLNETVKSKSEEWEVRNLISEWIYNFSQLLEKKKVTDMTYDMLKDRESEFVSTTIKEKLLDSLPGNTDFIKKFLGEKDALRYKAEADSAFGMALNVLIEDFKEYSVRSAMPGKLTGTNGFIDSSKLLLWPVKSDYFLTEPYVMWAESKTTNTWAWLISAVFVVFVASGIIRRRILKKD